MFVCSLCGRHKNDGNNATPDTHTTKEYMVGKSTWVNKYLVRIILDDAIVVNTRNAIVAPICCNVQLQLSSPSNAIIFFHIYERDDNVLCTGLFRTNRSYIGATIDPRDVSATIELAGGASHNGGLWRFQCVVSGFRTWQEALQANGHSSTTVVVVVASHRVKVQSKECRHASLDIQQSASVRSAIGGRVPTHRVWPPPETLPPANQSCQDSSHQWQIQVKKWCYLLTDRDYMLPNLRTIARESVRDIESVPTILSTMTPRPCRPLVRRGVQDRANV